MNEVDRHAQQRGPRRLAGVVVAPVGGSVGDLAPLPLDGVDGEGAVGDDGPGHPDADVLVGVVEPLEVREDQQVGGGHAGPDGVAAEDGFGGHAGES
jgi:hypothetical protein